MSGRSEPRRASAEASRRHEGGSGATSARPGDDLASEGNVGSAIAMTFVSRCEPRVAVAFASGWQMSDTEEESRLVMDDAIREVLEEAPLDELGRPHPLLGRANLRAAFVKVVRDGRMQWVHVTRWG